MNNAQIAEAILNAAVVWYGIKNAIVETVNPYHVPYEGACCYDKDDLDRKLDVYLNTDDSDEGVWMVDSYVSGDVDPQPLSSSSMAAAVARVFPNR